MVQRWSFTNETTRLHKSIKGRTRSVEQTGQFDQGTEGQETQTQG